MTPGDFGQQFGPSDLDIQIVSTWLLSQGFRIDEVARGRAVIEFSGTAGLVRNTFHTELHKFVVNGEEHLANVSDPQIPFALAPVVVGVASLHNFFKHSHHIDLVRHLPLGQHFSSAAPSVLLGNGSNAIGPADFATIYNINGFYSSGITGAGRTIPVVARPNIRVQDARDFLTTFGLPAHHPTILVNGPDPGLVSGH